MPFLPSWWPMAFGVGLFALFAFWVVDEWRDADSAAGAVQGAGKRADHVTGETLGAFGALVAGVGMIGMTIGQSLIETAGMLEPVLGQVPVLIGHFVVAGLGYLSLTGAIGLSAKEYGFLVILITVVALFVRYGRD